MSDSYLSRRNFNKLATAAFGGMVTGTLIGCGKKEKDDEKDGQEDGANDGSGASEGDGKPTATADVHVCRGLNACRGKGAGGDNACAGQGACATAEKHECAGMNACKNQGGCGETPGENACKGKGECAVPLSDKAWANARARFEERMKAADKPFGEPPENG